MNTKIEGRQPAEDAGFGKTGERWFDRMILDTLPHLRDYACLTPGVGVAADFLEKCQRENLAPGTYEIDGRNVYAMVIDYEPQDKDAPAYESHDLYLDIQCMLLGSEYQWYAPREALKESVPYNPEKDITRYSFSGEGSRLLLAEGSFAIYSPQDGHLPGVRKDGVEKCRRVVVKVKC